MTIAELRVPDSSALSAVQSLCQIKNPYQIEPQQNHLFMRAMIENISWHSRYNQFYAKWLADNAYDLAREANASNKITSSDDLMQWLAKLPPIPATFFKQRESVTVPRESISLHLTSSGTTGQKSQMFFDEWSIQSAQAMVDAIFAYYGWGGGVLAPVNYLLYSYETTRNSKLGTAYTDHYLCKYAPAAEVFTALRLDGSGGHEFDLFGTIAALERFALDGKPVRIFGFPAFFFFTLERMKKLGVGPLKLHPDTFVFLGGGWKGHADKAISKSDLYHLASEWLGIKPSRLRDGFGSVEHCIPYIECVEHRFHVPVWSRVLIRDVRTLEPLSNGQKGFLNLISPYITSVPANSVLMGDIASLHDECSCEINTPWFEVHGRAGTSKNKSCAVAASELLKRSAI